MQVDINSRGNGACPLCHLSGNCRIQDVLAQSIEEFSEFGNPMELVIYSCPQFKEKSDRE